MGTWGPGAFDSDDALDLLDTLTEQDAVARRETLERIFRTARQHPEDLNWTVGPGEIVAAAAVVAVGLPADEAVMRAELITGVPDVARGRAVVLAGPRLRPAEQRSPGASASRSADAAGL